MKTLISISRVLSFYIFTLSLCHFVTACNNDSDNPAGPGTGNNETVIWQQPAGIDSATKFFDKLLCSSIPLTNQDSILYSGEFKWGVNSYFICAYYVDPASGFGQYSTILTDDSTNMDWQALTIKEPIIYPVAGNFSFYFKTNPNWNNHYPVLLYFRNVKIIKY